MQEAIIMKILVIDDERPTLAMFKLFLTAYGYEVFTAESGDQGLAIFASQGPDIVFTDIRMPGMDGIAVLRKIRESGSPCQVIIITGHGDMELAMAALDLAASDFINKPMGRAALNAALDRAEKRLSRSGPEAFSVTQAPEDQRLTLVFDGRLTRGAEPALSEIDLSAVPEDNLQIRFKDNFTIDRHGLALLTAFLRRAAGSGIHLEMAGISYNYIRFFEMAGVDKLATIIRECPEEVGL